MSSHVQPQELAIVHPVVSAAHGRPERNHGFYEIPKPRAATRSVKHSETWGFTTKPLKNMSELQSIWDHDSPRMSRISFEPSYLIILETLQNHQPTWAKESVGWGHFMLMTDDACPSRLSMAKNIWTFASQNWGYPMIQNRFPLSESPEILGYPILILHFNGISHYKPSIFGVLHVGNLHPDPAVWWYHPTVWVSAQELHVFGVLQLAI